MSDQINSRTSRRKNVESDRSNKKNKKAGKGKGLFKKIFLSLVIAGFAVLIGGAGLFAYYASTAPKLDENLLKDPLSSEFLDKDQNVFMKFGAEKRDFIPYDKIPKLMEDAILATEDIRFYKHHGMDFWRLGGAVLANFKSGFGSQGASTITQQVIKNSFLKQEKTLKRKSQEAYLAFQLERQYDKEEIFEMYFNKILMSGTVYGFGTASQYFYGKNLDELELHEVALLAGLPQYPNGYNPFKNPERAEKRRNIVLGLMHQHKKITKEEMDTAKAIPVISTLLPEEKRQARNKSEYPAYVDIVLDELEAAGMMDVLAEGVKIQTALDPAAQKAVENALNTSDLYESEKMQAGMTVMDTKTGAIVAVGGGRDYSGRDLNFASDQKRQPGSVIKPILSYGPAIENLSWSTGQRIVDEPYNYKGTNKSIRNVDGKFLGTQTIREALYKSRNIPAIKVFEEIGTQKAGAFAKGLGLPYGKLNSSNALGGGEYNFSTVQIAGAYSAFGNGGIYTKPHTVKKIIFRDGKTERSMVSDPVATMKDSTAYMVTDILRDVVTSGTGTVADIPGLDEAGKTGTTNYPSEIISKHNMKNTDVPDSWFAGYTTDYTIAIWGGYKDYTTPITTYDKGRRVPQNLFRMVMSDISSGKDTAQFSQPGSVEEETIVYGSDPLILASSTTPANMRRTELFVRGTAPVEVAEVEEEVVIELEAPTSLRTSYVAETTSADLVWSHNAPNSETVEGDVEFTVLVSVDGSEQKEMTTTKEKSVTFSGVEPGKTYTFYVFAKIADLKSDSTSTQLLIEEAAVEEPIIEVPPIEPIEPIEPDPNVGGEDGSNNGNNGNNGNGSTSGDGSNNGNNPNDSSTGEGGTDANPNPNPVENESDGDSNP
ncbi:PBP1A family penicillin-binding protein [Sporosarcina limicola]|uniref:Penicillin-binding protein 1A n=1 Tax=Sporosarcina limicola TaxID=34101 RepID=A0A927RC99_9BACL|nr:PBP1A family penicillin-binding protein [Sporosarcina limicola]MBE1554145.1 penicillin-binding protein 1A [Sporosarcina limicola]